MTTYEDIYSFNVIDEIKKGNQVFVVDRLQALVHHVNMLNADALVSMIKSEEDGRYKFWKVIGEGEEED